VTVTLDAQYREFNEVRYIAAPGETNDLVVAYAADARSVTVNDPGAQSSSAATAWSRCSPRRRARPKRQFAHDRP
jgi:hypothetical protein